MISYTFGLSGCRIARLSLIKIHLDNTPVSLADEEWHMLVDKLDGYSGSDIRSVVIGALYEPIRSMQSACYWKHNDGMGVLFIHFNSGSKAHKQQTEAMT